MMDGQLLLQHLSNFEVEEEVFGLLYKEKHKTHPLALASHRQVTKEEVYYQKDHINPNHDPMG